MGRENKTRWKRTWRASVFVVIALTASSIAQATTAALSLSTASGAPGANVTLDISLTPGTGTQSAAVQWDLTYSTTDLSLVSGTYDTTGSAGSGAGKAVDCNAISSSDVRCIVSGLNTTSIGNGVIASITFKIAAGTSDTSTLVSMTGAAASDGSGNALALSGSGATVNINQPSLPVLSTLNCTPGTITTPGPSTCTATLSSAAPHTMTINLSSNVAAATSVGGKRQRGFIDRQLYCEYDQRGYEHTGSNHGHAGGSQNFWLTLSPPAPLQFYTLAPCRVADTRTGSPFTGAFGAPFLAGDHRVLPLPTSGCSVPSTAQAYSLNITVIPHSTLGYLTAWPTGESFPTVSTLNSMDGHVVANAASCRPVAAAPLASLPPTTPICWSISTATLPRPVPPTRWPFTPSPLPCG